MSKKIMFTGISDIRLEKYIETLGGQIVDSPFECDILVTNKVRRTFKFLCSLSRGIPIVSVDWLYHSYEKNYFSDPWSFILFDKDYEIRNNCSLKKSLEQATKSKLLHGYSIFVTSQVKPPPEEIKDIVEFCGGKFCFQITKDMKKSNHLIISSLDDKSMWNKFKGFGPIYTSEILLEGLFKHKLELNKHILAKK